MYFSSIHCKPAKGAYPAVIERVLEYIKSHDLKTQELGIHEIEGKQLYLQLFEDTTLPPAERKPETHKKYVDFQYLVSGKETIGVTYLSADYEVAEDIPERDLIFYKKAYNETFLEMEEGNYAVFFPEDVHRPCCMAKEAQKVRRAVFKIDLALFA